MDQALYLMSGGRWGYRVGNAELYDSMLRDEKSVSSFSLTSALSSPLLARR